MPPFLVYGRPHGQCIIVKLGTAVSVATIAFDSPSVPSFSSGVKCLMLQSEINLIFYSPVLRVFGLLTEEGSGGARFFILPEQHEL